MKALAKISLCLAGIITASLCSAIDLKQAKITQVVNDVQIISAAAQMKKEAAVNDTFSMPDILQTGAASRAELVAADQTVTRVGANTIFSFDEANRTIDLQQGSLLFHSPHGKGGGTIRTGSATASVLGTTIIVVTTPNGGFKVLDLEGEVEVRFLNGLKQYLKPGEMTFILPGGKQLAPIIVFRLDTLTKSSLLLNGFPDQLDSMPLIVQQIQRQLKLIKSGRATDTGLYAGDNAGPNSVEVLDLNSIQGDVNPSGISRALSANATINQPSLTAASIPTPPNRISFNPAFMLPGNFFRGQTFQGFAGRNIYFNTINRQMLPVNMRPYASHSEFDFVASQNLNIDGPVVFNGLSKNNSLFLVAGNQISILPGTTVQADVGDFEFAAPGAFALSEAQIVNNLGTIGFDFGAPITLGDNVTIHAGGFLNIQAASGGSSVIPSFLTTPADPNFLSDASQKSISYGNLFSGDAGVSIVNSSISSDIGDFSIMSANGSVNVNNSYITGSGSLTFNGAAGINVDNSVLQAAGTVEMDSSSSVNVTATSITANILTLNSGDGILLDANGHMPTAIGANPAANLTAVNTVTVNNVNLSGFTIVNMSANTIVLANVAFAGDSAVTLLCPNGALAPNPNTYAAVVPGDVNFVHDVTYGGNPAQNYVNNGGGITIGSNAP